MLEKLKKNKEDFMKVCPYSNIYQKDKDIVIAVEMPGAEKDSLDVNLEGNQLVISAKKKKDDIPKEYKRVHQERITAVYERTYEINTDIDRGKICAEYNDGILKVLLAKAEKVQPKKISIKT